MEPETPFLPEAGADPVWSEPESAARSRPRTSGAGADQKRSRLRNNGIRIRKQLMLIYSPDQDDMEKSMNSSYSSNRPGAK